MFFAISLSTDSDAQFHHPARETVQAAMDDADSRHNQDAQVVQATGLRRVIASREVGQAWNKL